MILLSSLNFKIEYAVMLLKRYLSGTVVQHDLENGIQVFNVIWFFFCVNSNSRSIDQNDYYFRSAKKMCLYEIDCVTTTINLL